MQDKAFITQAKAKKVLQIFLKNSNKNSIGTYVCNLTTSSDSEEIIKIKLLGRHFLRVGALTSA